MKIKLYHRKYSLLEQYFFILIAVYKKTPRRCREHIGEEEALV